MAKDPICGMYVDEKTATLTSIVGGKTYYFCASSCKEQFDAPLKSWHRNKVKTAVSWSLGIPVFIITYFVHFYGDYLVLLVLAGIVQFWPGLRFYGGLIDGIRSRSTNMDTLIAVGTTTAFVYSAAIVFQNPLSGTAGVYFDASSLIIALILTGNLMEEMMKGRASEAARRLMDIQPTSANVLRNGAEVSTPVEEVQTGDMIRVRPGEIIPVDGVVVEGVSEVDQSIVTGESIPVLKSIGNDVVGGTLNTTGTFVIRATTVGSDSALSQIIDLVTQAREGKASVQRLADRISSYFVPIVVSSALISSLFWYFVANAGTTIAILAFVSVIVVACPCSLGIATPAALMVGAGKGAKLGILFKGGDSIEMASKVDVVVVDKTGTLTEGRFELSNIRSYSDFTKDEIVSILASIEAHSEHPVAKAVMEYAQVSGIRPGQVTEFEAQPGLGIHAKVAGKTYWAGNIDMARLQSVSEEDIEAARRDIIEEEEKTRTVVLTGLENRIIGLASFQDIVREGSSGLQASLSSMGIKLIMITGDNSRAAASIANKIGISDFYADVRPEGKEKIIRELQGKGHVVAMVGDGINDAPSLASSDVGMAVGSGTDIAKSAGNVVLMNANPDDIAVALSLGRRTFAKIKQNLFWAFAYNAILIPVAAGALVPLLGLGIYGVMPILAAIAMAFSSTTVVTNSLMLNRFRYAPAIMHGAGGSA